MQFTRFNGAPPARFRGRAQEQLASEGGLLGLALSPPDGTILPQVTAAVYHYLAQIAKKVAFSC
jgi:hypothetical protein